MKHAFFLVCAICWLGFAFGFAFLLFQYVAGGSSTNQNSGAQFLSFISPVSEIFNGINFVQGVGLFFACIFSLLVSAGLLLKSSS
jgi:hypothetical protein